jgi:hypothetical protein
MGNMSYERIAVKVRDFDYINEATRLLNHAAFNGIGHFLESTGMQKALTRVMPQIFNIMEEVAHVHTASSCARLLNMDLSFEQIKLLVEGTMAPENAEQVFITRYSGTIKAIHNGVFNYENMLEDIVSLHNMVFQADHGDAKPKWRTNNELLVRATEERRFTMQPPPAEEAPVLLEKICREYQKAAGTGEINHFFLMPVFVVDFTAIQPFEQGNLIMTRLVVLYLLNMAGYRLGKYISIEHTMQRKIACMFESVARCLDKWELGANEYTPIFQFFMYMADDASRIFDYWAKFLTIGKITKTGIILRILEVFEEEMTKRMIMEYAPDVSESTIEAALYRLVKSGQIEKLCGGRYSRYRYIKPANQ